LSGAYNLSGERKQRVAATAAAKHNCCCYCCSSSSSCSSYCCCSCVNCKLRCAAAAAAAAPPPIFPTPKLLLFRGVSTSAYATKLLLLLSLQRCVYVCVYAATTTIFAVLFAVGVSRCLLHSLFVLVAAVAGVVGV